MTEVNRLPDDPTAWAQPTSSTARAKTGTQPWPRRLLVVSHVTHFQSQGRLFAYEAYTREVDIWADLFDEVIVAAPLRRESPADDAGAFERSNVAVHPVPETGGHTILAKLRQLLLVPWILVRLLAEMAKADAIHVRSPGNLGLLGALLAPLFKKPRIAKYAGQWPDYPGEGRTVRWQKRILASRWWRAPVTVYGDWQDASPNIFPFFTSILDAAQMDRARASAQRQRPSVPPRLIYVGRLAENKNVDFLLDALAGLLEADLEVELVVVGDGPEQARLESQAARLDLGNRVRFTGALAFDRVLDEYTKADILVLASEAEGWPKAIAESMAFGLVAVGSNRGLVPWMLGENRGVIVSPRDLPALRDALAGLLREPARIVDSSQRAAVWSQRFSLEDLQQALIHLFEHHWDTRYPADRSPIAERLPLRPSRQ